MARRTKTPAAPPGLQLPAELTIYAVAELHPQWSAWLQQLTAQAGGLPDRTAVQADKVDQVDAAGLQLLVALQRSLASRGSRLELQQPSEPLRSGCHALGLCDWLNQQAAAGVPA